MKKKKNKIIRFIDKIKWISLILIILLILGIALFNPTIIYDLFYNAIMLVINIFVYCFLVPKYALFIMIFIIAMGLVSYYSLIFIWREQIIAFKCEDTEKPNTKKHNTKSNDFILPRDILEYGEDVEPKPGSFVKVPLKEFSGKEIIRDVKYEITLTILGKKFIIIKPCFKNKNRKKEIKEEKKLEDYEIKNIENIE